MILSLVITAVIIAPLGLIKALYELRKTLKEIEDFAQWKR